MLIFVFSFSFLFALFSSRDQIFIHFFFSLLFFSVFWNIIINNHILSILTLFPVSIFSIRDRGGVELEEYTIIYGTAIFTRCLQTRGTYNKNSSMFVMYYTHTHTYISSSYHFSFVSHIRLSKVISRCLSYKRFDEFREKRVLMKGTHCFVTSREDLVFSILWKWMIILYFIEITRDESTIY